MKFTLIFVAVLMATAPLHSQKIKFKKGIVSVDGTEKYKIDKIKSKETVRPTINMSDLEGNLILEIKYSYQYFKQLDHEEVPVKFMYNNELHAPQIHKSIVVPYINRMKVSKYLAKTLEKTEFYKTGEMTESILMDLADNMELEKYKEQQELLDEINKKRVVNSKLMVEKFGPMTKRNKDATKTNAINSVIKHGPKVATYKQKEKGKVLTIYSIMNLNDEPIARLIVDTKLTEDQKIVKYSVITEIDDIKKEFTEKRSGTKMDSKLSDKLEVAAEYLVQYGYL